jgi:hypothetical protein
MDKPRLIALYDQHQRIDFAYLDKRREVTPHVVRHIALSASREGEILFSQLDETNADELIRQQVNYFESLGQDFEWTVFDYDQPSDLKERLASYGFKVGEAEALLVLDLDDAPEVLWQPAQHDVRRIRDTTKLGDILVVEEAVWQEDFAWLSDSLGKALRDYPDQMSIYAAYIDDHPVSAAWIYFPGKSQFANLLGGATLNDFRKRGLYSTLLAVRAQEARARGMRYLTVDPSPMSRPILEKFGFRLLAYWYGCKWKSKSA